MIDQCDTCKESRRKLMRYAFVEKKEAGARGKGERGSFEAKCIKSPRRDLPRREERRGDHY
jgi:hypothetical protein